jgi:hypothetical protein
VSDDPGESFADVLNGMSGPARPKGERRGLFRRRSAEQPAEPIEEGESATDEGQRSGDPAGAHAWTSGEAQTAPYGTPTPGAPRHELPEPEPLPAPAEDIAIVRPYAWTGGRTRPTYDLEIETLVSVASGGRDPSHLGQYEHRAVAELCREPRSVAEVAALLTLPLGVARVLIGDMASQGTVVVHQTAGSSGDVPDTALMERVLSGLRRL